MSIGPILPGRLPDSLTTARLQQNLQRANQLLMRLQDQAATGQKFFFASDSPGAALRTINLQKTLERQAQLQVNVGTDSSLLSASEAALASVSDSLIQAKTFVITGIADTSTPAEKLAMATEVSSMI